MTTKVLQEALQAVAVIFVKLRNKPLVDGQIKEIINFVDIAIKQAEEIRPDWLYQLERIKKEIVANRKIKEEHRAQVVEMIGDL